jgi:hypothetical protein
MIIVRKAGFVAGGPKGRDAIATFRKGVVGKVSKSLEGPKGRHIPLRVSLSCRAFGAQLIMIGSSTT